MGQKLSRAVGGASLIILSTAFAFAQNVGAPGGVPVVTVEPACMEWPRTAERGQPMIAPHITIRYNPRAPGARLTSAQSLTLVLATGRGIRFDSTKIPMTRVASGTWQAGYTPERHYLPGYAMFFFEDEKNRTDNHDGEYWDILNCYRGEPDTDAVSARASTYEGRLIAPGIQRTPDLGRALGILKDDLKLHPYRYGHYFYIWHFELKMGGESPSAYKRVGDEVDAFVSAHANEPFALAQIHGFIGPEQQKLPASVVERFRQAVAALPHTAVWMEPSTGRVIYSLGDEASLAGLQRARIERFRTGIQREVSDMLADLDYWAIFFEQADLQKKAQDYVAFAAKYPQSLRADNAYQGAFNCDVQMKDVSGAEVVFEKMAALDPENPFPMVWMAQFYVDQKAKPERAIKLLDSADALFLKNQSPSVTRHFHKEPGKLEFLRGQAYLLLNDLVHARADFEAAAQATPDDPKVVYALGQVCEKMGDTAPALEAYLAAASAPYQETSAPREAYERLFVAQRLGTTQDAEQKILQRVAQNSKHAAAEYTPIAMNRPAPEFALIDLAGNRFDGRAAKGKPTILTFWGIWCVPCVAELPALQEFQRRHPDVNLLAVEIGSKPEEVKSFLATHRLDTLRVAVRKDMPLELGAGAFPYTLVIDRFGQIQFVHAGQLPDVGAILGKDLEALPGPD